MNNDLSFLIAAYTSIWIVLAIYILVLLRRNRNLTEQISELEERMTELEGKRGHGASP